MRILILSNKRYQELNNLISPGPECATYKYLYEAIEKENDKKSLHSLEDRVKRLEDKML